MHTKFIFVTGGVVSSLGKGITAASLGRLLKCRGLRVSIQKFDPYINVDPGTMNPYQHGEVFVTDDGAETDLDLGHYERFIDENLTVHSSVSSGKVYWNVLNRERTGDYLGATVQIIPHITNEIKRNIYSLDTPDTDVAIVEIGGATEVYACATHGVLSGPANERIADSCIKELTFLNTIPPLEGACSKIKYLDVSPIFADAIQRIYEENSMSVLF